MLTTPEAQEFQGNLQRLESLLQEMEESADPAALARTREFVQAILQLHRAGIERMLDQAAMAGNAGNDLLAVWGADEIVSGLLLLHGLHPLAFEDRVQRSLERVRPLLRSHGGTVTLLGLEDGVVRLQLGGNCHGCGSSAATMRQTVEEAIIAEAPEVVAIQVEVMIDESAEQTVPARVALPIV